MTSTPGMTSSSETLTRPDGSPVRVLVVDDEQMLADLLASALRYEGWEVTTAGTGVAAVRAAQEIEPDVIVLDIMLPDFDGLEVQAADPGPGVELRLRRAGEHRRALHLLPAPQDRQGPRADDSHHARRRLRAQAGRFRQVAELSAPGTGS